MKATIELLTAVVVLTTALVGLNKAGIATVPLVNQVTIFQSGGNPPIVFPPSPGPTQSTKIAVPDVRGLLLQEARERIDEEGFNIVERPRSVKNCDFEAGRVDDTNPPAGVMSNEGGPVTVYVCE
jgi:hypothetical protein